MRTPAREASTNAIVRVGKEGSNSLQMRAYHFHTDNLFWLAALQGELQPFVVSKNSR
ncbi:MAG: hypothetical protein H6718_14990 [Polyangiaceae bacterium]|nr:hypothetical protein [Myxococcales bacterium]MCB9586704.1 hypothetical protein [Polyangiaceae bacterium]MCB9606211.1 hypothetical protein [Polyangiaceae bacterium]